MKIVKVIMLGSAVKEYEVSNNPTVRGLADMMEEHNEESIEFNGTFTRGGYTLSDESQLADGDSVYYAEKLKGNQLVVKVIRIGAVIVTVAVEPGSTVRSALNLLPEADRNDIFGDDGSTLYEIRIGTSQPVSLDAVIPGVEHDEVNLILSKKLKGN